MHHITSFIYNMRYRVTIDRQYYDVMIRVEDAVTGTIRERELNITEDYILPLIDQITEYDNRTINIRDEEVK